ncbi:hypothetical protein [uncultured Pseudoteredinibacter sp.]|uniref:hypothetical protein n=1 Tax=uncultured Pseudoteredinibacter sp. TaxID=1641701 RepID=UPI00263617C7|nr:hypothetical protein [uncultured Pseudoteredinibacter sp.]
MLYKFCILILLLLMSNAANASISWKGFVEAEVKRLEKMDAINSETSKSERCALESYVEAVIKAEGRCAKWDPTQKNSCKDKYLPKIHEDYGKGKFHELCLEGG